MKKQIILLVFGLMGVCLVARGQQVALKTNLLHGATATPNVALEVGLGKKTSLDLYGAYNWFDFKDNKKWKHWMVQPEFRWWWCERFNGSFLGVHLHGGEFNVGNTGPFTTTKNHRYEGYFYGGGFSYGHQWMLSNRLSIELEVGAGYARIEYDKFRCEECSPKIKSGTYNYFGPTKAVASVIFFLW